MDISVIRERLARNGLVNIGENLDTSRREIWLSSVLDSTGKSYPDSFVCIERMDDELYHVTVKRVERDYAKNERDVMSVLDSFFR